MIEFLIGVLIGILAGFGIGVRATFAYLSKKLGDGYTAAYTDYFSKKLGGQK